MAQNTVLAAAQTAATSSDIVVAAGSVVTVGLFSTSGSIPPGFECLIDQDSPGGDIYVGKLSHSCRQTVLSGPGTFRVRRPLITSIGVNIGVFTET